MIESMACGTPVIVTDCDYGPREIVTDRQNGLIVPTGDVGQMTRAINRLLSDEVLCEKLSDGGKVRAADFDPAKIGEQYEAVLNSI